MAKYLNEEFILSLTSKVYSKISETFLIKEEFIEIPPKFSNNLS